MSLEVEVGKLIAISNDASRRKRTDDGNVSRAAAAMGELLGCTGSCVPALSTLLARYEEILALMDGTIDSLPDASARTALESQRAIIANEIGLARRLLTEV